MIKRILSISYDPVLLNTRGMILRQEGYAVDSAQTLQEAVKLSRSTRFDVVIIGHSIPAEDQQQMAEEVRKNCPGVLVVALRRRDGERLPFADLALEPHKPEEMMRELRHMLGQADSGQSFRSLL